MAEDHYQLIVIGGGAAGFFGAIAAAENGLDRILILEKSKEVLSKVRISGGGRCNVTHHCLEPSELIKNYPRGHRSLRGPFSRFHAADTITWFQEHGVDLKTEPDGRMFPTSNTSETIVNCLTKTAQKNQIEIRTRSKVTSLQALATGGYTIQLANDTTLQGAHVIIATGGLRGAEARQTVRDAEHNFSPPVPSLFTFHIDDPRLTDLQGVSIPNATISALKETIKGPVLITHWGLSGPAILKLSAWNARLFSQCDYQFSLKVNWTGALRPNEVESILLSERKNHSTRSITKRSLIEGITNRFWLRLCETAKINAKQTWANLTNKQSQNLIKELTSAEFKVTGKSTNKDEFVTCGGVHLKDLNLKTMESKTHPGLHFAGEVLDIDGITGGFNFQAAWTTGHLAGTAIATT